MTVSPTGHGLAGLDRRPRGGLRHHAAGRDQDADAHGRECYLATFATAGGLGFGVASVLAGQLAALFPAHFVLVGEWWTSLHVLFALSARGRLAAAGLSLRLHDPGAPGDEHARVRVLVERTGITTAVGSFRKNPRAACL